MKVFTKVSELIKELLISKGTAKLKCKPTSSKAARIREQAKRAGFKISVKKVVDGYEVEYREPVPLDIAKAATNKKTRINTRYQSSHNKDWHPGNSRDPMLKGETLEEIMTALAKAGGGTFKTQCTVHQIRTVAEKIGVTVKIARKGDWREVEVICP